MTTPHAVERNEMMSSSVNAITYFRVLCFLYSDHVYTQGHPSHGGNEAEIFMITI